MKKEAAELIRMQEHVLLVPHIKAALINLLPQAQITLHHTGVETLLSPEQLREMGKRKDSEARAIRYEADTRLAWSIDGKEYYWPVEIKEAPETSGNVAVEYREYLTQRTAPNAVYAVLEGVSTLPTCSWARIAQTPPVGLVLVPFNNRPFADVVAECEAYRLEANAAIIQQGRTDTIPQPTYRPYTKPVKGGSKMPFCLISKEAFSDTRRFILDELQKIKAERSDTRIIN